MKNNQEKFKIFLEVTKSLNSSFHVTPILFGSLGLSKILNKSIQLNDIDILIPENLITKKWGELVDSMKNLNFELKDTKEHEFIRDLQIVNFGKEEDVFQKVGIDPRKLTITKFHQAEFKELSAEKFLQVYRLMLRDDYRQEKRGDSDKQKIALIEKFLKNPQK